MAKSLYNEVAPILFVADGVEYQIRELSPTSNGQVLLGFEIEIHSDTTTSMVYKQILLHAEKRRRNNVNYYLWSVDLADILSAYVKRLFIQTKILGYAKVRLMEIDGTEIQDDTQHICLFGTSGGLVMDGIIPANKHPFLVARGNEQGALHFYRSELEAMEYLFAFCTNEYDAWYIETDERQYPDQDLDNLMFGIDGSSNLVGIHLNDTHAAHYAISGEANALFLYFNYYGTPLINTVAINADPDTDEKYLIRWTNSMGAPEALLLTGELQDISEVNTPELYITGQALRSTERKQKRSLVTTKYRLQSGYLTPARIIALRDMLSSEDIEMKIDGQWIPVSVTADTKHAVHQREPESFELTIEVLEQTRYHKPNRSIRALPASRAALLQDNSGNIIVDNNSDVIY